MHLCFKEKPFLIKHGVQGNKNNLLKIWKFQGGGGHQTTPWNGNSKGVGVEGGGVVENNLPWGVWIFSGTTQ